MQESKNVDDLLYSPRNFGAVWETTMLMDEMFKLLTDMHKKYNCLLPLDE